MRYIPIEKVRKSLPVGWEERAQKLTDRIRPLSSEERKEVIRREDLWRKLREPLKGVMNGKCWYCESKQCRTNNPIDHFRPKNSVSECKTHQGYWWLAYKWENYRYCCNYCNSYGSEATRGTAGGKHDHFPLWDETRRSMTVDDDLTLEQPLLLDPCCITDPELLWFNEDGSATSNPCAVNSSQFLYKRAIESIHLYHLNQKEIKEKRAQICSEIKRLITIANRMFLRFSRGDQTAQESYEQILISLYSMIKEDAEYSMAALSMLMGLRGKSPAAEAILQIR